MKPLRGRITPTRAGGPRSGLTLMELIFATVILALLLANASMVSRTGSRVATNSAFISRLTDEVDVTLDRITLALMSARHDDLYPQTPAPGFSEYIGYSVSLGMEEGKVVYGPPERIDWIPNGETGRVTWYQDYSHETEKAVVLINAVTNLQEGELPNEIDDNGNNVQDEGGLAFVQDGKTIRVFLTVERNDENGTPVATRRKKIITCRN